MSCDRPPLAPIKVPEGALHPAGSEPCLKCGGQHKRVRLIDPVAGPVYSEICPKDFLVQGELLEVKPMAAPSALIFYADFKVESTLRKIGSAADGI